MKLSNVKNKVGLGLRSKSPEILIGVGIIGVVASTIMACRASRKVDDVLNNHKERAEEIDAEDHEALEKNMEYNRGSEVVKNYANTSLSLARLYAPAIALGIFSVGCIFQSHKILRKRNIALAAAYNTLGRSFKEYRKRVLAEVGEDVERRIRSGITQKTVEVKEVDKNGKEKIKKEKIDVLDVGDGFIKELSPYARIFDEGSTKWQSDNDYNRFFLEENQRYANDYLNIHGYLFLNQVYEWLGLTKTLAGQQVGWIKDGNGDNYVDFGIREIYKRATAGHKAERNWVNGYESAVWLDFNVDGVIMNEAFDREI